MLVAWGSVPVISTICSSDITRTKRLLWAGIRPPIVPTAIVPARRVDEDRRARVRSWILRPRHHSRVLGKACGHAPQVGKESPSAVGSYYSIVGVCYAMPGS